MRYVLTMEDDKVKFYGNRLKEAAPTSVLRNTDFYDLGALKGKRYRWLMWADLSDAGEFTKATLVLDWYYPASVRTNDTVIQVFRAKPFDTMSATWGNSSEGYIGDMVGSVTLSKNALPSGRVEIDITSLVKEYISSGVNDGFFIKAETEGDNYVAFSGLPDIEYVNEVPEYAAVPCEKCGENTWSMEKKLVGNAIRLNCLKCGSQIFL